MKLYRTTLQTGADSFRTLWSGSQADASRARAEFKKLGTKGPDGKKAVLPESAEIDVPTGKADLLAWLNVNLV